VSRKLVPRRTLSGRPRCCFCWEPVDNVAPGSFQPIACNYCRTSIDRVARKRELEEGARMLLAQGGPAQFTASEIIALRESMREYRRDVTRPLRTLDDACAVGCDVCGMPAGFTCVPFHHEGCECRMCWGFVTAGVNGVSVCCEFSNRAGRWRRNQTGKHACH